MRPPALRDLPPPPEGRTGWPWTEAAPPAPAGISARAPTRMSVVTPSYNQGDYLEECIRAVLLQDVDDLEYIVIDGGSTDQSADILRRYSPWLAHWVSERDRGYAEALNKGFARATGEVFSWINSSDRYQPGALARARAYFADPDVEMIFGRDTIILPSGEEIANPCPRVPDLRAAMLYSRWTPMQDACFWRAGVHRAVGPLSETLRFAGDFEFFLRMSLAARARQVPDVLSSFRHHEGQLSSRAEHYRRERNAAWRDTLRRQGLSWPRMLAAMAVQIPLQRYRMGGVRNLVKLPSRESFRVIFNIPSGRGRRA